MKNSEETLAGFILAVIEGSDISESEIAKRSGGEISQGYINDIKNHRVLPESLSVKKIRALAKGIGITEEEMFARVRGIYKKDNGLSQEVANFVNELPASRQKDLLEIAKLFFNQESAEKQKVYKLKDEPITLVRTNKEKPNKKGDKAA